LTADLTAKGSEPTATLKATFPVFGKVECSKLQVNSKNELEAELTMSQAVVKELALKAAVKETPSGDKNEVKITGEYKNASTAAKFDVELLSSVAGLSATYKYQNWLLGAALAGISGKDATGRAANVLLAYKDGKSTAGVATLGLNGLDKKKLQLSFLYDVADNVKASAGAVVSPAFLAAKGTAAPAGGKKDSLSAPADSLEFGLVYTADKDAVVHAKASSAGLITASYAQQISALTKLTVAAQLDAKSASDLKYGFLLNYTP